MCFDVGDWSEGGMCDGVDEALIVTGDRGRIGRVINDDVPYGEIRDEIVEVACRERSCLSFCAGGVLGCELGNMDD